jgi:uncharacterized protein (TIGR03435 family)
MGLFFLIASAAVPAATQESATFEAASLKPFPADEQLTWTGCQGDAGRVDCRHVNLRTLIARAYSVRQQEIFGPAWIDDLYFNVDARMPAGTKGKVLAEMTRNLLIQRFHLETHPEQRSLGGYALTVGKALKIKETPSELPKDDGPAPNGPLPLGADGFRVLRAASYRGGRIILYNNGHAKLQASNLTLGSLAQSIQGQLDKIVVDETGLAGKYDVMLYWAPQSGEMGAGRPTGSAGNASVEASGPDADLFAAVEQQLGLKLVSKKVPRDCVIVDKVDKTPTDN